MNILQFALSTLTLKVAGAVHRNFEGVSDHTPKLQPVIYCRLGGWKFNNALLNTTVNSKGIPIKMPGSTITGVEDGSR